MDLRKKIEVTQFFNGETLNFDPDSSPDAINYYKTIYKDRFKLFNDFDFSKIRRDLNEDENGNSYNRIHITLNKDSQFRNALNNPYFDISGDCDFNFNDKKFNIFKNMIDEKSHLHDKLIDFNKNRHHSLINMSFMLTTGAMNSFKGYSDSFDGLDQFLYNLNNYYNNVNENVLSKSSEYNKKFLKIYLDTFNDIYDYCYQIYFIEDNSLIDSLISLGGLRYNYHYSKDSENKKNEQESILVLYMNLAERYWEEKEKNIKKHLKNNN